MTKRDLKKLLDSKSLYKETEKYVLLRLLETDPLTLYADFRQKGLAHLANALLDLCGVRFWREKGGFSTCTAFPPFFPIFFKMKNANEFLILKNFPREKYFRRFFYAKNTWKQGTFRFRLFARKTAFTALLAGPFRVFRDFPKNEKRKKRKLKTENFQPQENFSAFLRHFWNSPRFRSCFQTVTNFFLRVGFWFRCGLYATHNFPPRSAFPRFFQTFSKKRFFQKKFFLNFKRK